MSNTRTFLTALRRAMGSATALLGGGRRGGPGSAPAARRSAVGSVSPAVLDEAPLPGRAGPEATVEVDPLRLRGVRLGYAPERDDLPDPGEVVWTWVPYAERDGRGKDRPVVIMAAGRNGDFLAIELTSKSHERDLDYVPLGAGGWDAAGRPSWARIDRVFRVRAGGMRREAAALDRDRYRVLEQALRDRYGWR